MNKYTSIVIMAVFLFCGNGFGYCADFDHIEQLFDLRTAITNQGDILPDAIKKVRGENLRTLERIFELNTSTLTMIEAYFRLSLITITTNSESDEKAVNVLNGWLTFTNNQCTYDLDYLMATLQETTDEGVVKHIQMAKQNTSRLSEITKLGIEENSHMLEGTKPGE